MGLLLPRRLGKPSSISDRVLTGLEAYYPLNEGHGLVTIDSSGKGRHGDIYGSQFGYPEWQRDPDRGTALRFDGSDDYVHIGNWEVAAPQISFSCFFLGDDFGGTYDDNRFFMKGLNTSTQNIAWMFSTYRAVGAPGTVIRVRLKTGTSTGSGTSTHYENAYQVAGLQTGKWYHAAAVYDGANVKIYRDGELTYTGAQTGVVNSTSNWQIAIGAAPNGTGDPPNTTNEWDGMLDDVRIYSRALDHDEILQIADAWGTVGRKFFILNAGAAPTIKTVSDVGAINELFGSIAVSAGIAESSSGSDALPGTLASLGLSEISSGIDSSVIASALVSVADSAVGADISKAATVTVSLSESGSSTESVIASVALAISELGTGADAVSVLSAALKLISDAAAVADVLSVSVSLEVSEASTASDSVPLISVSIPIVDSGSAIDSVSLLTESLKIISDLGGALDGLSLSASIAFSDSAAGDDTPQIAASVAMPDAGSGTDALTLYTDILKQIAESGLGSDSVGMSVTLSVAESILSSESAGVTVALSVSDLSSATTAFSVVQSAVKLVSEFGFGADSLLSPEVSVSVVQAGTGADSAGISAAFTLSDGSSATDVVNLAISVFKALSDLGSGSDVAGISVFFNVPDLSSAEETLTFDALVSAVEFAGGTEVVTVSRPGTGVSEIRFTLGHREITFALTQRAITFTLS